MNPLLMKFFPSVYRKEQEAERNQSKQYCKFDSQLLTLFTSSLYIAGLLTAMVLSSWFTARHGRRSSWSSAGSRSSPVLRSAAAPSSRLESQRLGARKVGFFGDLHGPFAAPHHPNRHA